MTGGTLVLNGNVDFSPGTTLRIDSGTLSLGDKVFVGGGVSLICNYMVSIGTNSRIGFRTIVSDTDFHFISKSGKIRNCCGKVSIGNDVWIGNSATIHKGSLPDKCIVASKSFVNKNFSDAGTNGILLAGVPAQVKGSDYYRIFSPQLEEKLRHKFTVDPSSIVLLEEIID